MDIETFMKREKPEHGFEPVVPFEADICALIDAGYSLDQVQRFLASNDVEVSGRALARFVQASGLLVANK